MIVLNKLILWAKQNIKKNKGWLYSFYRFLFAIYKLINNIYFKTLDDKVVGHMFVFIEEPLILESIKSIIDVVDELYISYDISLETAKKILDLRNDKIRLFEYKNINKSNYWKAIKKTYKKVKSKYYLKIDADQIYFGDVVRQKIKNVKENAYLIENMWGINIFNFNERPMILNNTYILNKQTNFKIKTTNGLVDNHIIRKSFMSRYKKLHLNSREMEVFRMPFFYLYEKNTNQLCWFHLGPIKLGIKLNKNYFVNNVNEFHKAILNCDDNDLINVCLNDNYYIHIYNLYNKMNNKLTKWIKEIDYFNTNHKKINQNKHQVKEWVDQGLCKLD